MTEIKSARIIGVNNVGIGAVPIIKKGFNLWVLTASIPRRVKTQILAPSTEVFIRKITLSTSVYKRAGNVEMAIDRIRQYHTREMSKKKSIIMHTTEEQGQ